MIDPISLTVIAIIGGIFLVGAAAALAMWHQILDWSRETLVPFLEKRNAKLAKTVRLALTKLDQVAVAIRRKVKKEWERLRQRLLKHTVELSRSTSSIWIAKITTWLLEEVKGAEPKVVKSTTEIEVPYDELPEDVRAAQIQRSETSQEVNFTELRDKEVAEVVEMQD